MKTAEDMLNEKGTDIISVSKDATVFDALKVMNENKIGAILIKEGEEYVGIWTERDLMKNTIKEGFDPKSAKISDQMNTGLKYCEHNNTLYQLQDKFLGMRLRHLLIQKEGKFIGLISAGDVMKTILNEKEKELKDLNALTSWEYYENWRWEKK
ncbi:MAG: CBS domain-containing protein [Bacteroidetes bacterium]|nr:CBS domain-containing protein [Bacteroidota bacterium]